MLRDSPLVWEQLPTFGQCIEQLNVAFGEPTPKGSQFNCYRVYDDFISSVVPVDNVS